MFQFSRFPIARSNCKGIPIRRSVVLRLRAAPYGFSQLGTSVVGFRAELSTRRHSSQFTIGCDSINYTSPVDAWIARTYGVMHTAGANRSACRPFLPTLARGSALVFRITSERRPTLKGLGSNAARDMDPLGFEPRASSLQRRCSAAELWARRLTATVSPSSS